MPTTKEKTKSGWRTFMVLIGAVCVLSFGAYEFHIRSKALADARTSGYNDRYLVSSSTFHTEARTENINKRLGIKLDYPDEGMFIKNHKLRTSFFNVKNNSKRTVTSTTNNLGLMSNRHFDVAKKEGVYRIVVMGQEQTAATTAPVSWPDNLWTILDADDRLKENLKVSGIEVYNLAWPDARMYHYEIMIDQVELFKPDLVIMNLAAHDFTPYSKQGFDRSQPRWQEEKGLSVGVEDFGGVDDPADMAFVSIACRNPPVTMKNPNCILGRPINIFAGANVINDDKKILQIIDAVRNQYIDGAIQNTFLPLSIMQRFLPNLDPETIRFFEYSRKPASAPAVKADKMSLATRVLRKIHKRFPNLIVLRNPVKPEMLPKRSEFPFFTKLQTEIPEIPLVKMSEYLAHDRSDKEISALYRPDYDWKWTEKGHLEYAKSVSTMLNEIVFNN